MTRNGRHNYKARVAVASSVEIDRHPASLKWNCPSANWGTTQKVGLHMSMTTTLQPALFDDEQVPQILPDDSPRVRRADPITSHLAADSISKSGRRDSQQHVILDLTLYGRSAAWQIEERAELTARQWSPSRLRTALKELVESGRVVKSAAAGETPRGRACAMYEVVSA